MKRKGVEWSGVECCGADWSEVKRRGVDWSGFTVK